MVVSKSLDIERSLNRIVGQADVMEAYKLKSWLRVIKCKLAWLRRVAEVIRFYLLQYVNKFSVNYL